MKYDYIHTKPSPEGTISGILGVHNGSIPDDCDKALEYLLDFYSNRMKCIKKEKDILRTTNIIDVLTNYKLLFVEQFIKIYPHLKKQTERERMPKGNKRLVRRAKKKLEYENRNSAFYSTQHWIEKRTRVLVRDGNMCSLCGSRFNLHVHHLKYREKSDKDKDCLTLCIFCHAKEHPINGRKMIEGWMYKNGL